MRRRRSFRRGRGRTSFRGRSRRVMSLRGRSRNPGRQRIGYRW